MATITINIQDKVAQEFRKQVQQQMGEGKGILGKAVEAALKQWIHEQRQEKIAQEMKEITRKGLYSLKGWKFNRAEIYDRR